ncbi:MAG: DNA-binding protein [Deltaproteobacteria bacterium]|nr:DNA-binding protein [Deltaproteobacteria bacterium]
MSADKVRLSLDVSPELNRTLDELALKIHGTKSDVLRKAIVLMELAVQAKDQQQKLGIIDKDRHIVTEIVGL